jgi:murein DD-endopeptidase MepM/ murein hydrolase activator NlpD
MGDEMWAKQEESGRRRSQAVACRPRRSARREAQVRRRRFVALAVIVVGVTVVLLASGTLRAGAATLPGAGATLATIAGSTVGDVFEQPSVTADDATVSDDLTSPDLVFKDGLATVRSMLVGTALSSESDVSLSDVSLLGGAVTADSIELVATADAGASSADAAADTSYVTGLAVDGQPVSAEDQSAPITVPDVGSLTVLTAAVGASAPSPSATITGLTLVLDQQVGDLPAGSVVTVGRAVASADAATARELQKIAARTTGPTPLPAPQPTPTKTSRAKTKHTTHAATGRGGSSTGSSSGGGGSVAGMPAPAPPTKAVLDRFPGAVFPVRGKFEFADTFGAYRADVKGHRHEGNDIFAKMGTPIVAVLAGTIEYSTHGIGGNNARLTDAAGDYFYYAHMVHFAAGLHSGDHVAKGQVIGYVGETGDAAGTSPHCHFEIHPDGGPAVDPYPYLEAWRAAAAGVPAAAGTPIATLVQAGVGIPLAKLLARRGVHPGVELGVAAVAGARAKTPADLPQPNILELVLFVSSLGGLAAIRRLRATELPELLAAHETVVRRTVVVASRPLTKS